MVVFNSCMSNKFFWKDDFQAELTCQMFVGITFSQHLYVHLKHMIHFQGPSASAYVTYIKSDDALKAILAVNNVHIDGRTLKASLGTTKYCSHFLRGTQCPKTVS